MFRSLPKAILLSGLVSVLLPFARSYEFDELRNLGPGIHTLRDADRESSQVVQRLRLLPPICALSEPGSPAYCIFTSPGFANGRGISIIARQDRAEIILNSTAFTNPQIHLDLGINKVLDPPYRATELEGRGIGLVVNRTIKRGEWLMSFTPAFMIEEQAYAEMSESDRLELQRLAFERLPQRLRSLSYDLYGQAEGDAPDRVDDILGTNTFGLPVPIPQSIETDVGGTDSQEESEELDFKFLFPEIAVSQLPQTPYTAMVLTSVVTNFSFFF